MLYQTIAHQRHLKKNIKNEIKRKVDDRMLYTNSRATKSTSTGFVLMETLAPSLLSPMVRQNQQVVD